MSRSSALLTVATVAAVGSLVLYALYFDHKRRSDAAFRKQLRASYVSRQQDTF
jgi:import receptor subunit TOM20